MFVLITFWPGQVFQLIGVFARTAAGFLAYRRQPVCVPSSPPVGIVLGLSYDHTRVCVFHVLGFFICVKYKDCTIEFKYVFLMKFDCSYCGILLCN